jgi:hypothetical protein
MTTSEVTPAATVQHDTDWERQKLALEREKLEVERAKSKWNAAAIAVPLLAAVATAWFGLASQKQQAESQFAIKAAEIVLQTKSPEEALDKAKALKNPFPRQLPDTFAKSFEPANFPSYSPDIIAEKLELLKMLGNKSIEQKKEILWLWTKLYRDDDAGAAILADLESRSVGRRERAPASAK